MFIYIHIYTNINKYQKNADLKHCKHETHRNSEESRNYLQIYLYISISLSLYI